MPLLLLSLLPLIFSFSFPWVTSSQNLSSSSFFLYLTKKKETHPWLHLLLENGRSVHPSLLRMKAPQLVQGRRRSWIGQLSLFEILGIPLVYSSLKLLMVLILLLLTLRSSLVSLGLPVLCKSQIRKRYWIFKANRDLVKQFLSSMILLQGSKQMTSLFQAWFKFRLMCYLKDDISHP